MSADHMPLFGRRKPNEAPSTAESSPAATQVADRTAALLSRADALADIKNQYDVDRVLELVPELRVNGHADRATELVRRVYAFYMDHGETRSAENLASRYRLGKDAVADASLKEFTAEIGKGEYNAALATAVRSGLGPARISEAATKLFESQTATGDAAAALDTADRYLDRSARDGAAQRYFDDQGARARALLNAGNAVDGALALADAARFAKSRGFPEDRYEALAPEAHELLTTAAYARRRAGEPHVRGYDILIRDWPPRESPTLPYTYGFRTKEVERTAEEQHTTAMDGYYDIEYRLGFTRALAVLEQARRVAVEFGLGDGTVRKVSEGLSRIAQELFVHQADIVGFYLRNPLYVKGYVQTSQGPKYALAPEEHLRLDFTLPSVSCFAAFGFSEAMVETARKYELGKAYERNAEFVREFARHALQTEARRLADAQNALEMELAERSAPRRPAHPGLSVTDPQQQMLPPSLEDVLKQYEKRINRRSEYVYSWR